MNIQRMGGKFGNIDAETVFVVEGCKYVKVPEFVTGVCTTVNAIKLDDGGFCWFRDEHKIEKDYPKVTLGSVCYPAYVIYKDELMLLNRDGDLINIETGDTLTCVGKMYDEEVWEVDLVDVLYRHSSN